MVLRSKLTGTKGVGITVQCKVMLWGQKGAAPQPGVPKGPAESHRAVTVWEMNEPCGLSVTSSYFIARRSVWG